MSVILAEKAMLVRLSISQWSARRFDRNVTADIHAQYRTPEDAGRYNKALISLDRIKAINKAAGAARSYHYKMTLPWKDEGDRILPAALFMEYRQEMQKLEAEFWKPVDSLVFHYPGLVSEAHQRLGRMFNSSDYPDPGAIRGKFGFSIEINPMPTAADFRVDLQGQEIERVKETLTARLEETQTAAMQDVWNRVYTAVAHIAERMDGSDTKTGKNKVFRDSLVTNLTELVDLLPKLNLTDDPNLEVMRREIETKLTAFDPQTLREEEDARRLVKEDADTILSSMGAFMGTVPDLDADTA